MLLPRTRLQWQSRVSLFKAKLLRLTLQQITMRGKAGIQRLPPILDISLMWSLKMPVKIAWMLKGMKIIKKTLQRKMLFSPSLMMFLVKTNDNLKPPLLKKAVASRIMRTTFKGLHCSSCCLKVMYTMSQEPITKGKIVAVTASTPVLMVMTQTNFMSLMLIMLVEK